MTISPLAGKPAPKEMLIDVAQLEREYYDRQPDLGDPNQLVSFGTSGHRGTPLQRHLHRGPHPGHHAGHLRLSPRQQGIDGPLYMGKDTHALSGPAQRTALEVLAANGVETIIQRDDGVTPTPVDLARHSRSTIAAGKEHLADGIVITPSHNPPEDGGFKYNPPNGGPADTDVTSWVQDRANELLRGGNSGRKARAVRHGPQGGDHARRRISCCPMSTTCATSSTWTPSARPGSSWASIRWAAPRCLTGSRSTRVYGLTITVVNPKRRSDVLAS